MGKITVTLDASKLRNLITERTYTSNEGEEIKVQEVKFEIVELKEKKTLFSGEKHEMIKTHFACAIQTKEEREAKKETNYIGQGITVFWKNQENSNEISKEKPIDEADDLPF